jgi:hypothetical protein
MATAAPAVKSFEARRSARLDRRNGLFFRMILTCSGVGGAPPSMKVGNTVSPCPYDVERRHVLQSAKTAPARDFALRLAVEGFTATRYIFPVPLGASVGVGRKIGKVSP